jgi:hypothetical protein
MTKARKFMGDVNPDLTWCTEISERKGLSGRCPFASAHRCPRYFQSLSLLGEAGSTKIDPAEDQKLLEEWKASDLWPVTSEQATSIFGPPGNPKIFGNFCPEVAFDRFGIFACSFSDYADELDRDRAHSRLGKEHAEADDWRWNWQHVHALHYSECALYSPLSHDFSSTSGKASLKRREKEKNSDHRLWPRFPSAGAKDRTKVQSALASLQNHRFVSIVVVAAIIIISLAKFLTSIDEIRRFVRSFAEDKGTKDVAMISGTAGDVIEIPIPPKGPNASPLNVTSIRTPRSSDNYFFFDYDVYLDNPTDTEIITTSLGYSSQELIPRGDAFMGTILVPHAAYIITYRYNESERVALSPPYIVPARGHGAIRLYLRPNKTKEEIKAREGMAHVFKLILYDSHNGEIRLVNTRGSNNTWD